MPVREFKRLGQKDPKGKFVPKIKIPLATHEDFMRYLGHLDPKKLLDGIDNFGGEGEE